MLRTIYLTGFVILSAIAGFFYYSQTRLVPAVVATTDLKIGAQVEDADVSIRRVSAAALPAGTLTRTEQAVGRMVSFPVLRGQFLDVRQLAATRNAELLQSGLSVPAGFRIISLPIQPAAAVGGALKAGDVVDVIAVPNTTKAPGTDEPRAPRVIGKRVLVLGLRSEQGTELDPRAGGRALSFATTKAASILLAVPESDETNYSAALVSSTFFFALATD